MNTTSGVTSRRDGAAVPPIRDTAARRGSVFLSSHPRARLWLLLSAPLTWLVVVYIVALVALLITAFWKVDSFTGEIQIDWTFDNIVTVLTGSLYHVVTLRTLGVALAVTIIDIALALPIAFYMAKVASPRMQRILVIAVLMPLWASYLVKGLRVAFGALGRGHPAVGAQPLRHRRSRIRNHGDHHHALVPVVALRHLADLRRTRACAGLVDRSIERSRC